MTETMEQRHARQRAEWQAKKLAGLVVKVPGTFPPPAAGRVHWNGAGTRAAICGAMGQEEENVNKARVSCGECVRILRMRVGGPRT